jgi:hypothetical protein
MSIPEIEIDRRAELFFSSGAGGEIDVDRAGLLFRGAGETFFLSEPLVSRVGLRDFRVEVVYRFALPNSTAPTVVPNRRVLVDSESEDSRGERCSNTEIRPCAARAG